MGAALHRGARASHYRGLSCCGAHAPDAQAQQLWLTGLGAPRHVGSTQTGLKPVCPALAGRFSTTAPPGKPQTPFLSLGWSYPPCLVHTTSPALLSHELLLFTSKPATPLDNHLKAKRAPSLFGISWPGKVLGTKQGLSNCLLNESSMVLLTGKAMP